MSAPTAHPRLFREKDADASLLHGKTIAVLGYGLLGRPLALNVRDTIGQGEPASTIIVGSDDDASSVQARDDGFPTESLVAAAQQADVALMLLPDFEWLTPNILGMNDCSSPESSDALPSNLRLIASRHRLQTLRLP